MLRSASLSNLIVDSWDRKEEYNFLTKQGKNQNEQKQDQCRAVGPNNNNNQHNRSPLRRSDGRTTSVTGVIIHALREAKIVMDREIPGACSNEKIEYDEASSMLGEASIFSEVQRLDTFSIELQQKLLQFDHDFHQQHQLYPHNRDRLSLGSAFNSRRSSEMSFLTDILEEDLEAMRQSFLEDHPSLQPGASAPASVVERGVPKKFSELSMISDLHDENIATTTTTRQQPPVPRLPLPAPEQSASRKRCESFSSLDSLVWEDYMDQHDTSSDDVASLVGTESLLGNESLVPTIIEEDFVEEDGYDPDDNHGDDADGKSISTFATLLEELDDLPEVSDPITLAAIAIGNNDDDPHCRYWARSLSLRTATNSLATSSRIVQMHNNNNNNNKSGGPMRMLPRIWCNKGLRRVDTKQAWTVGVPILGSATWNDGRRMVFLTYPSS